MNFIKSVEKQKEWYNYIVKGRKDIGFNAIIEPDYDIIIDHTDKSIIEGCDNSRWDDKYFTNTEKEESSKETVENRFKIQYGRELVKLYSLIWDTQNPIQNFILKYKSDILNEDNIMLFIEFGLKNGYIAQTQQFSTK